MAKILVFLTIICFSNNAFSQVKKVAIQSNADVYKSLWKVEERSTKKIGYINDKGKIVIEPKFEVGVDYFTNNFCSVKNDGKWGAINMKGEMIIPFEYDNYFFFYNGLAIVKLNGTKLCINTKGETIGSPDYKYEYTKEGMIEVSDSQDKKGFLNSKGELVIPCKYKFVSMFKDGLSFVNEIDNNNGYFIDKSGKKIYTPENGNSCDRFSEGLASFKDLKTLKYGFVNKKGVVIVKPIFKWVKDFSNGLALVENDNLLGYINTLGKVVIEPKYYYANDFKDGVARVQLNEGDKEIYIDKLGRQILQKQYKYTNDFSNGIAMVNELGNDNFQYINKNGEVIHDVTYGDVFTDVTNFDMGNGYSYTGQLKNDLPDGQGKWIKSDGSWHEGEFKNGEENGKGTRRMNDGKRYYGYFVNGKAHGVFEVKQWTLGGLMSNEWYAEYNMGNLVSSQKTKDDFDKFLSGSGSSSNSGQIKSNDNQESGSNSSNKQVEIVEIEIKSSGKSCCTNKSESYCFNIYEDGKKLNGVDTRTISKANNGDWVTDCSNLGSWKVCNATSYTEALKNYYRKKYKKEPQEFKITE
jgi:hypothetical protein